MRIGKRLFPYPIVNNEKLYSQFKSATFSLTYEEEISGDEYFLKDIHCILTSDVLVELISQGKATIFCIVECAETMFRKNYELSLAPQTISLPVRDLNGKVAISAFVVAKCDIDGYYSDDFLDDYDEYSFGIEKYDILAADDGFVNKLDFDSEVDDKKSSIFLVIKDGTIKDETMQITYDSSKIIIYLPENQWNLYDKSKRMKKLENLYFSVIAIPAISHSLSCLQAKADTSIDVLRMDYKWFDSFAKQYEKVHGEELTEEIFYKCNPNLEAQLLMNTPVTKAIDDIFGLTMGAFEGEDDGD